MTQHDDIPPDSGYTPRPANPNTSSNFPGGIDRRRPGWSEFRHAYPGILTTLTFALVAMLALDTWLITKHVRYKREVDRLRSGMTTAEKRKADLLMESEENKFRVMIELIRRQARGDRELNLAISVDSGLMYLAREGAVLREMKVDLGPEKTVGTSPDTVRMTAPRGQRTVEKLLGPNDAWEVPAWVYTDRGQPVPGNRQVKGALGSGAVVLNGGTVIYARPSAGPLADSMYVMPGAVRTNPVDLRAIAPNLKAGMPVYFY